LVDFREPGGRLGGACLTDVLADGLSLVYSFFQPDLQHLSLGSAIILWHIQRAAELNLDYVYLGYWIAESEKMAYKTRFTPMEALKPEGWVLLKP
jgi:arginine-tRNA-protein transferase